MRRGEIMIGWWMVIDQQTPEERDAATDKKATILSNWETSVGGIDWIDRLVKRGKATQLSSDGYPNRYVVIARDVLPILANGIPLHSDMTVIGDDYVMPAGWTGNIIMHQDKIAPCPPDQVLTIDAWDQG